MNIKAGIDRIGVRMSSFYEDTIEYGNLVLHKDPTLNETANVRTIGEIVAFPMKQSAKYLHAFSDVEQYEEVLFDFKSLEEEEYVEDSDGKRIYFVPFELVYAFFTRSKGKIKKIKPGLDIVLCLPHYDGDVEEVEMPDGSTRRVIVSSSGIIATAAPKPDERIAYIAHVGPQDPCDPVQEIDLGWKVFRDAYTNYEYEIGTEKFYIVRRENLGFIVPPQVNMSQKLVDDVRDEYGYDINEADLQEQRDAEFMEMVNHKKVFGFN